MENDGRCQQGHDGQEAFQDAREEAGDEAEGDAAMQQYADGGAADAARAAAGTRAAHRTRTADPKGTPNKGEARKSSRRR